MLPAITVRAQTQTVNRDDILYIMPYWGFTGASDAAIQAEIQDMRNRLGPEGPYVKLGFSTYIFVSMDDWNVDITDPAAIRANLAEAISQIDNAITRAHNNGILVSLSIVTPVRGDVDAAQSASQAEDIRSMMWYADNVLASGWWTYSRYARKQMAVREAYVRELGKILANRMSLYPDTLVAAAGDGEQELAAERPGFVYADYSPFTVAEFRDWIRHGGLYADGAQFSGQGYSLGARYAGDRTPGEDTNRDGHTLNGDFHTNFQTWDLLHFNWNLADPYTGGDPNAIAFAAYSSAGYVTLPGQIPGGFDAPRTPQPLNTDPWWDLWVQFKQIMLQRHNQDFAKWITTSQDADTGATVPPTRWYSYQIPADYLFNGTPDIPNPRWYASMSSYWTADVAPYGGLGITAFNIDYYMYGWWALTLPKVAPHIARDRGTRWGIVEWHPGTLPGDPSPGASTDPLLFENEMAVVEKYRPSLLQPFMWGSKTYPIQDTLFQTSLHDLIARIKDGTPPNPQMAIDTPAANVTLAQPFTLSGWAVDLGKIRGPGRGPGIDEVNVYAYPNADLNAPPIFLGQAAYGGSRPDIEARYGTPDFTQFTNSGFSITVQGLPAGRYKLVAYGRSTVSMTFNVAREVTVDVYYPLTARPSGLDFGATKSGATLVTTTPAQVVTVSYSSPGTPSWSATADQAWVQVTSGPGFGQFTIGIINPNDVIGGSTSLSATVTISDAALGAHGTVPIHLTVKPAGATTPDTRPFGAFDLPIGDTTLSGSFAVTGWALDDVGVDRVEIWRDLVPGETTEPFYSPGHPGHGKIFIANATFVEGSRPDIETSEQFRDYPFTYRSGWGYLLLSRGLWNQGNGTYTLYAFAFDKEGNVATLGSKRITVDNEHASKPFGAIDTPEYGRTAVSGGFWNYGWALTPNATPPCTIRNGSVFMTLDSRPAVVVNYGAFRSDIAAAFPDFTNTNNSSGAYYIDTTQLSNGMHQIGWLVYDDCGRGDGVGSRFFWVSNPSADVAVSDSAATLAAPSPASDLAPSRPLNTEAIAVRQLEGDWQRVPPTASGVRTIEVRQGGRIEVRLPPAGRYVGFQTVNRESRSLPVGSSLDAKAGVFYWQPAPGFLGSFDLRFDSASGSGDPVRVQVVISPSVPSLIETLPGAAARPRARRIAPASGNGAAIRKR
jgi:hypothetical protein